MGTYLLTTKANSDVKRMFSKLGLSVHDTTVCRALVTMAERKAALHAQTVAALAVRAVAARRRSAISSSITWSLRPDLEAIQLVTGTGCTALLLDDCAPGAFNLDAYQDRVILNARAQLTVNALLDDVNYDHLHHTACLHMVCELCSYVGAHVPAMKEYLSLIMQHFRTQPVAIHRRRAR
ncbi:hypothetical protein GGX14DRAFT_570824 [Mycena pura]|uniref:Uncharacterized protein n=1 Tax=Mycena pura TaxID=153505 RepID=A0AAD6V4T4_9AGAR|nr:hypothetical protein GGX14DRAFT_570824 [Mycena pura]